MEDLSRQADGEAIDTMPESGVQLQKDGLEGKESQLHNPEAKAGNDADTAPTLNVKEFM